MIVKDTFPVCCFRDEVRYAIDLRTENSVVHDPLVLSHIVLILFLHIVACLFFLRIVKEFFHVLIDKFASILYDTVDMFNETVFREDFAHDLIEKYCVLVGHV